MCCKHMDQTVRSRDDRKNSPWWSRHISACGDSRPPPGHLGQSGASGYSAVWQRAWFGARMSEVRILLSRLTAGHVYPSLKGPWFATMTCRPRRSNSMARVPVCRTGSCGFESRLCRRAAHTRRVNSSRQARLAALCRLRDVKPGHVLCPRTPRTKKPGSGVMRRHRLWVGSEAFNLQDRVRVPVAVRRGAFHAPHEKEGTDRIRFLPLASQGAPLHSGLV